MDKLEIIDPKFETTVFVDMPLLIPISLLEPENDKREEPNGLIITGIPLELVESIFMNLHPLELYCCYGVSKGIRRIVKKKLMNPKTLGVYISDKVCVVFSDGMYTKYNKEVGGSGYGYGTYEKNEYGNYMEDDIPFEINERTGFLKNVKYDQAGFNVFVSILTYPGNHLKELSIRVKDGCNPNKFIAKIEKALVSLNKKLRVAIVRLMHVTPKQVMRILSYLKPKTLKKIFIHENAYAEQDNETMRKMTRTEQFKQAATFKAFFSSTIPFRKFLHLGHFLIFRKKMTAREIVSIRNSMLEHQHIQEIEVVIEDVTFDLGIARRVLGPYTPDPTDPDGGFYHGPTGVIKILMDRDDGSPSLFMIRWSE